MSREAVTALARRVLPVSREAYQEAERRQSLLAKPPGSLGRLEALSAQLASIAGSCPAPVPSRPVLLIAAGDHGVHAQGVSAWPQHLSTAVAAGCASGTSVAAALARDGGVRLVLLDVGLCHPLPPSPNVRASKVAAGTGDLSLQDAMTPAQAAAAVLAGARVAEELIDDGADVLLLGEVGIANTTAAACIVGQLTGTPAGAVTGPGAGADDDVLRRKQQVVVAALKRVAGRSDGLDVLAALGGFEHAALAGALLYAAGVRVPVVLDGVSAAAAALCAAALAPAATGYLIASHRSGEPGAGVALAHLGLSPLLELDLRLGEGSGALLGLSLVRAAAVVLRDTGLISDL